MGGFRQGEGRLGLLGWHPEELVGHEQFLDAGIFEQRRVLAQLHMGDGDGNGVLGSLCRWEILITMVTMTAMTVMVVVMLKMMTEGPVNKQTEHSYVRSASRLPVLTFCEGRLLGTTTSESSL